MKTYTEKAELFAAKHRVKLTILGSEYKPYFGESQYRYVFKCKLTRNGKQYVFEFGQSIQAGATDPTMYDILACLQKYDVGSLEDFCADFGYDIDSKKSEKIYKAVCKEYRNVERLFSDIMDELQAIQ